MVSQRVSAEALGRAAAAAFRGRLVVALFSGSSEESDPGYVRRAVTLTGPESEPDGSQVMVNADDVVFAPYEQESASAVDGWALFDGAAELVRGGVLEPRVVRAGDQFVLRAGMIRVGFAGRE